MEANLIMGLSVGMALVSSRWDSTQFPGDVSNKHDCGRSHSSKVDYGGRYHLASVITIL